MRDGRGWILIAISLGSLFSLGVRLALPALLPQIKAEFLLTNTTAGIVLSVLWFSFAVSQLPGGVLSDRIGERNTVVMSMALSGLGLLVIVLSPGFTVFVGGLVLLGLGTGLFGTPRITIVSDIYPERAATAISVPLVVGNIGNAMFPVLATVITGWFAWRAGIGFSLPAFVALVGAFWMIVPARTSSTTVRRNRGSGGRVPVRVVANVTRRPVVLATIMMACLAFVWQGFTAFLATYLVEVKGISQPLAAVALGSFFVSGGILQPIAGSVADEYDERRIVLAITGGATAALVAFPFLHSTFVLVGLSVLAGIQLAFWPVIFAYVPRVLPDDVQGSVFGLLRTLFLVVGATGPIVVGALADNALFDESFLLLGGVTSLAMILSTVLPPADR